MSYINLTPETIDSEHICCCFSDADQAGTVDLKKAWMKAHFADCLVFRPPCKNGGDAREQVCALLYFLFTCLVNDYIIV